MKPRVKSKALDLMRAGKTLTKYELAEAAPCHVLSAHRALKEMHAEFGNVRIAKWVMKHNQPIPAYKIGRGEDAPRPTPKRKH